MLEIKNFSIGFKRYGGWFGRSELIPIRCLDLEIEPGHIVSVVGESGAGKSLLAHALLGLLPGNARVNGQIRFQGEPLTRRRIGALRGRSIAFIPQSVGFLNPLWRVGGQVARAARLGGKSSREAGEARDLAFERYNLADHVKSMFPHQISGGMARRVLTAAATVGNAELIVADEPTSGMDGENSRKALEHLRRLADGGRSVLLITHDIEAAVAVSDRVAVFRDGVTVETAPAGDFTAAGHLRHPYTRQLFNALPQNEFIGAVNGNGARRRETVGCVCCGECPREDDVCCRSLPPRKEIRDGWVRCHHA
jgi:peptide/nickel transport system ATP-binding protein